jgi:hypothetical protein
MSPCHLHAGATDPSSICWTKYKNYAHLSIVHIRSMKFLSWVLSATKDDWMIKSQGVTPPQDMIVEGEGAGGRLDEPTPPGH